MELKNQTRAKPELSLRVLDERTYDIERQFELANAVFGLTSSYLLRVREEDSALSNAMPILRHDTGSLS